MGQPNQPQVEIATAIRSLVNYVVSWLKLFAGVVLAVVVIAALCAMMGYPIPYISQLRASPQEIGIFAAAIAYWIKN